MVDKYVSGRFCVYRRPYLLLCPPGSVADVTGWDPQNLHGLIGHMFPGLDMYYQYNSNMQILYAQHNTTAGTRN